MPKNTAEKTTFVIGMGHTGMACARFLLKKNIPICVVDTRKAPPAYQHFREEYPDLDLVLGDLPEARLKEAHEIVLSPGVPKSHPSLIAAAQTGVPIVSDIDLFRRYVKKPIIAITGSNAKSSVTTLVGKLLQDAGVDAVIAGNIGIPVVELLNQGINADVYVLELSSFQLETTHRLNAKVATILNITEDHMDRYDGMPDYIAAKQRIFDGCEMAVVNGDDAQTQPTAPVENVSYFRASVPNDGEYGLVDNGQDLWLAKGNSPILKASELKVRGRHNQLNALAALAIGEAMGLAMESMVCTLTEFAGLAHRCEWVATINGVEWFNDSKGTNVGATQAAVDGIGADISGQVILLAGGEGKGADFSILADVMRQYVKQLIVFGRDAELLDNALQGSTQIARVAGLDEAIMLAEKVARPGDAVVLSPACASFDMFEGFEARGEHFLKCVHQMEVEAR